MSEALEGLISSETVTLSDYLNINGNHYVIPFSQRDYEWDKSEVKRLFNDFVGTYELSEPHILNFLRYLVMRIKIIIYGFSMDSNEQLHL